MAVKYFAVQELWKKFICDINTKNIVLESAYFLPENINAPLNIQSDARYRFERGIDPESIEIGLDLAFQYSL